MAIIKVAHSQFEEVANTIDSFVEKYNNNLANANDIVLQAESFWDGSDKEEFMCHWNDMLSMGSVHKKFIKSLEEYAEYLRDIGNAYKEAQSNAINRARNI